MSAKKPMQNITFAAKRHRIYSGFVKCDLSFLVFWSCIDQMGCLIKHDEPSNPQSNLWWNDQVKKLIKEKKLLNKKLQNSRDSNSKELYLA